MKFPKYLLTLVIDQILELSIIILQIDFARALFFSLNKYVGNFSKFQIDIF